MSTYILIDPETEKPVLSLSGQGEWKAEEGEEWFLEGLHPLPSISVWDVEASKKRVIEEVAKNLGGWKVVVKDPDKSDQFPYTNEPGTAI